MAMANRIAALGLLAITILTGCSALDRVFCSPNCKSETRNSSSLVSFLYPDGKSLPPNNAIPALHIPLRVGLAFLPSQLTDRGAELSEATKEELLERIKQRFADRKFINEIVVIPDYYLKTNRGYSGLEGIQRLYNVDLMALVSYDQITNLDDNKLSLGYLTIVGAYVLKGTGRDVATLVDLAVVDPATRSLVIRAGGTDTRHGASTLIDTARETRVASGESFSAATNQMIEHFDTALVKFESDVHSGKANVQVVSNQSGSGTLSGHWIMALFILLLLRRLTAGVKADKGLTAR